MSSIGNVSIVTCWRAFYVEDGAEAVVDQIHEFGREAPLQVFELDPVNTTQLSYIYDTRPRQPSGSFWEKQVAGSMGPSLIGCERNDQDGSQAAGIEPIALHDQRRTAISWAGTDWLLEIDPPNLTANYFHSERFKTAVRAAFQTGSGV